MKRILKDGLPYTIPEIEYRPKRDQDEFHMNAEFADGRRVQINALSVVNVRTASASFDEKYRQLSAQADLIIYNGHAGLGANIRSLARKGNWQTGQYTIVFMNGCDTYAYVDDALFTAHANINPDDDTGTRYVDVINNAMPSYFASMARTSGLLVEGLLRLDDPLNYQQIFRRVDPQQIILVTGEEDNEFVPNAGDKPDSWQEIQVETTVKRGEEFHFDTPVLDRGTYRFTMQGTKDADLYVRLGLKPSVDSFDCRPYSVNSQEICEVTLDRPVHVFAMVRGWSKESSVQVEVTRMIEND